MRKVLYFRCDTVLVLIYQIPDKWNFVKCLHLPGKALYLSKQHHEVLIPLWDIFVAETVATKEQV